MMKRIFQTALLIVATMVSVMSFGQTAKVPIQFTPQNSAILLVDHQAMTMNWIYSQDKKKCRKQFKDVSPYWC